MGQISRLPLRKEVYERMFELLIKALVDTRDSKEAAALLKDLLTPVERIMIAKRLAIAVLLAKDKSYAIIQDVLKVSRPTITAVSANLKFYGKGYRQFTEKLEKEKKWQKLWDKIENFTIMNVDKREKGSGIYLKMQAEIRKERKKRKAI